MLNNTSRKVKKSIWVLMNPDHGRWDEETIMPFINRTAMELGLRIEPTWEFRDTGFGQELEFVAYGGEEDINEFLSELNEEFH
jgi:hypothetical protein